LGISIIVCTRNRPDQIRACLAQIARIQLDQVTEILVLDQSSHPLEIGHLPPAVAALLRYHRRPGRGLAKARNQAIRLAQGDILVFTDDDCVVTEDWAAQIARAFAANPHVDAVYGRVLAHDDGGAPITYHHWATAFGELCYATRPDGTSCTALFDKTRPAAFNRPVMPLENVGAGNNMAFRRSVFACHGLFIEQLGTGGPLRSGEDCEFHYRLLRAGRTLLYSPAVLLYHNSWLAQHRSAPLHDDYTCGIIAVFVSYALRGDRLAWEYLRFRLGTVRQEVATSATTPEARKPLSYYTNRAQAFGQGFVGGVKLALLGRRAIPAMA
jgi:GT2 family glycosyltransferase